MSYSPGTIYEVDTLPSNDFGVDGNFVFVKPTGSMYRKKDGVYVQSFSADQSSTLEKPQLNILEIAPISDFSVNGAGVDGAIAGVTSTDPFNQGPPITTQAAGQPPPTGGSIEQTPDNFSYSAGGALLEAPAELDRSAQTYPTHSSDSKGVKLGVQLSFEPPTFSVTAQLKSSNPTSVLHNATIQPGISSFQVPQTLENINVVVTSVTTNEVKESSKVQLAVPSKITQQQMSNVEENASNYGIIGQTEFHILFTNTTQIGPSTVSELLIAHKESGNLKRFIIDLAKVSFTNSTVFYVTSAGALNYITLSNTTNVISVNAVIQETGVTDISGLVEGGPGIVYGSINGLLHRFDLSNRFYNRLSNSAFISVGPSYSNLNIAYANSKLMFVADVSSNPRLVVYYEDTQTVGEVVEVNGNNFNFLNGNFFFISNDDGQLYSYDSSNDTVAKHSDFSFFISTPRFLQLGSNILFQEFTNSISPIYEVTLSGLSLIPNVKTDTELSTKTKIILPSGGSAFVFSGYVNFDHRKLMGISEDLSVEVLQDFSQLSDLANVSPFLIRNTYSALSIPNGYVFDSDHGPIFYDFETFTLYKMLADNSPNIELLSAVPMILEADATKSLFFRSRSGSLYKFNTSNNATKIFDNNRVAGLVDLGGRLLVLTSIVTSGMDPFGNPFMTYSGTLYSINISGEIKKFDTNPNQTNVSGEDNIRALDTSPAYPEIPATFGYFKARNSLSNLMRIFRFSI